MEVRLLPSAAGGLLPAGTASTVRTNFLPTPLFKSFCLTKMRTHQTTFDQLALPCWRKVIETKPGELWRLILVVVQGVYATAHFWEGDARCFAGRTRLDAAMVYKAGAFLEVGGLEHHFPNLKRSTSNLVRRKLLLWQIATSSKPKKQLDRVTARGYENWKG